MPSIAFTRMDYSGRFVDVWKSSGGKAKAALDPLRPDTIFLSSFVHPLTSKRFISEYFGRKCVVFRGSPTSSSEFVEAFLSSGDVESLASSTASEAVHCWLRTAAGSIETVRVPSASDAMVLHRAGASLYFRAPKEFENAFVPALSDGLGLGRGGYYDPAHKDQRGEVETFVSRAGHVTNWHWDFQHNFTLQLSGRKVWRVKWGGVPSAARGATPHYKTAPDVIEMQLKAHRCAAADVGSSDPARVSASAASGSSKLSSGRGDAAASAPGGPSFDFSPPPSFFDDAEVVELRPGDRFHFPPGMWHRVECEEDSLSINVSLVGQTWGDMLAAATRHLLHRTSSGRGLVSALMPACSATAGAGASSSGGSLFAMHCHAQRMLCTLQAALAQLRPGHLLPPVSLVSRRFSRLHGAGQLADSDSDSDGESESNAGEDDEDEDEDADDPSSSEDDSTNSNGGGHHAVGAPVGPGDAVSAEVLAAHGLGEDGDGPLFRVWLHKGMPVITLADDADDALPAAEDATLKAKKGGKGTAGREGKPASAATSKPEAASSAAAFNPLAVIFHGDDVVHPRRAAAAHALASAGASARVEVGAEAAGRKGAAAISRGAQAASGAAAKRARPLSSTSSAAASTSAAAAASAASSKRSGPSTAKRPRKGRAADSDAEDGDRSDNGDDSETDAGDSDSDDVASSGYLPPSPPAFDCWIVNINWGDDPEALVSHVRAVLQTPRSMRSCMHGIIRRMALTAPGPSTNIDSMTDSETAISSHVDAGLPPDGVPRLPAALQRALLFLGVLA